MAERTLSKLGEIPSNTQRLRWFQIDQAPRMTREFNPFRTIPSTLPTAPDHQSSKISYPALAVLKMPIISVWSGGQVKSLTNLFISKLLMGKPQYQEYQGSCTQQTNQTFNSSATLNTLKQMQTYRSPKLVYGSPIQVSELQNLEEAVF